MRFAAGDACASPLDVRSGVEPQVAAEYDAHESRRPEPGVPAGDVWRGPATPAQRPGRFMSVLLLLRNLFLQFLRDGQVVIPTGCREATFAEQDERLCLDGFGVF